MKSVIFSGSIVIDDKDDAARDVSPWMGAFESSSGSLPITLLYFDAKPNGEHTDLEWATTSETNNDYFTVQRSSNVKDFEIVVHVPGAGNSNQTLYYSAVDEDPYHGMSYYRLKQTDHDGKISYSDLVAVEIIPRLNLSVRPNPATDYLEVRLENFSKNTAFLTITEYDSEIKIFDTKGQLVYEKKLVGTFKEFNIDISSFDPGMYFVSLTANPGYLGYTSSFVKE